MDKEELLFRSMLESGQEEVPDHVWSGVVQGLDRAVWRRRIMRAGSAVAAVTAAAAVAVGVVLWDGGEDMIVPEAAPDMIAVVTNDASAGDVLLADIPATATVAARKAEAVSRETVAETIWNEGEDAIAPATEENVTAPEVEKEATEVEKATVVVENQNDTEDVKTSWEEDERELKNRRMRTSLILSGVAGTNNPQAKSGTGPLRSPGILKAPTKTTVRQVGEQTTYGIPMSVGAGVRLHFNKRWSLGMGLNYTLLTSKFNGEYTKVENGTPSLPISDYVRNTQHYVGIPINAYYNIVSRDFINFYAYAGGTIEKCVNNHYQLLNTQTITHNESVKGVQLSANAGIGVEFMFGRYVGLYLDPSLRYYFSCGQPKSIRTAQPLMLGFELGFRFNL